MQQRYSFLVDNEIHSAEDIFAKVYPFVDTGAFMIDLDQITKYRNPDGTTDYLIDCKNRGHWSNFKKTEDGRHTVEVTKMYEGMQGGAAGAGPDMSGAAGNAGTSGSDGGNNDDIIDGDFKEI